MVITLRIADFQLVCAKVACFLWVLFAIAVTFSTALTNIFGVLAAIFSLLSIDRDNLMYALRSPVVQATLGLWLFLTGSIAWSIADNRDILAGWGKYRKLLYPFLILVATKSAKFNSEKLIKVFGWTTAMGAVLSVVIEFNLPYLIDLLKELFPQKIYGPGNPTITFSYITQGAFLSISSLILICFGMAQLSKISRLAHLLASIVCAYVVVWLLPGFTGIFMLTIGAIVLSGLLVKQKFKNFYIIAGLLIILIAALMVSAPNVSTRGNLVTSVVTHFSSGELNSPGVRLQQWKAACRGFLDAPIVGNGVGSFSRITERYANDAMQRLGKQLHPHSEYLNLAVQGGIVGVALWIMFCYFGVRQGVRVLCFGNFWQGALVITLVLMFATGALFNSFMWDSAHGHLSVLILAFLATNATPNYGSDSAVGEPRGSQ